MLRSDLVATFVLIADAESLHAAAGRLGISRSVVSDRLKALEADLGTRLVIRTTRSFSLTAAGELFLEHARELLSAMDAARDAVAGIDGSLTGRLRIAVPEALAINWLTLIFARFLEQHTRLKLEISSSDQTVDIVGEGFDLAIRGGRLEDSELLARRLTTGRRMLVCAPDYAERHGLPSTLNELGNHVAVIYRNRRVSQDWTFRTPDGVFAARISGRFESDSGAMICQAAVEGAGIAMLPTFMTAGHLVAGRLIPVDVGCTPDTDTIAAIYPRAHRAIPRITALIDHIHAMLGDPPPWDRQLASAGLLSLS